jgi:hypothetical protein
VSIPPALADAVRVLVLQTLQAAAVPTRDEFRAWLGVMEASRPPLTPPDRQTLALALPALQALRAHEWFTTGEVMALAGAAQGPHAAALRHACARFAANADPAKAVGRFLRRCAGRPVAGLFLERLDDSAGPLYRVVRF